MSAMSRDVDDSWLSRFPDSPMSRCPDVPITIPTMRHPLLLSLLLPILLIAQTQTPASVQGENPAAKGMTMTMNDDAREQIEEAVKHLLVSQVEAWNHGNLEGFMQGYWQSPDLTFFSGTAITKGWEPTLARYRQRYQSEGKEMGHLEFQDLAIDALSGRSAVVTGKWQLTMKDGKQPHGLFTLVLKRIQGAGWRIVHDHTSGE
jgi:ketosteroid isomerase-like protein